MISTKSRWITTAVVLVVFSACQKENQEAVLNTELDTSKSELLKNDMANLENVEVIDIESLVKTNRRAPAAQEPPGDLEDVPEVTDGAALRASCVINPDGCDDDLMLGGNENPVPNSIAVGKRLGIVDVQNLNNGNNNSNRYTLPNGRLLTGFNANERIVYLKIPQNGKYRIQLSLNNSNRDIDIFAYKLGVVNGQIVKTGMKAWGINSAGRTETFHLTEKGYYMLILDSQQPASDNNYVLSVSKNTTISTNTRIVNNKVAYQFVSSKPTLGFETLVQWRFQQRGSTIANYYTNLNAFWAFPCRNCDWLVTPVYRNTQTGQLVEHSEMTTLIRP